MKRLILFLFIIIFIGCKKENNISNQEMKTKTFFDFDEIEYYKIDLSDLDIDRLFTPTAPLKDISKGKITIDLKKELLNNFLIMGYPSKIDEIELNSFLKLAKNHNIKVDEKYFNVLKSNIFIEKECNYDQDMIPSISPIYKDFFIFKKEHKIIGLIKINSTGPFMHMVIGTKKDTRCFGQNGEINYLEKILKIKI